jgi:hypothetical protein
MAKIKEVPSCFQTSDGGEFPDRNEAAQHQEFLDTVSAYEEARKRLSLVVAQSQRTADGEIFEFGVFRDYLRIVPGWSGRPTLATVHFNYHAWAERDLDHKGRGGERVQIVVYSENKRTLEHYPIDELYAGQKAANRALLKAVEEWMKDQTEALENLKSSIRNMRG